MKAPLSTRRACTQKAALAAAGLRLGSGDPRALKAVMARAADAVAVRRVRRQVDHPNCIKLYAVYITQRKVYIVTELVTGGELLDRCGARAAGGRSGHAAKRALWQGGRTGWRKLLPRERGVDMAVVPRGTHACAPACCK